MKNETDIIALRQPDSVDDPLTEIARDGARRVLAAALRAEAEAFVAQHAEETLSNGRQGLRQMNDPGFSGFVTEQICYRWRIILL